MGSLGLRLSLSSASVLSSGFLKKKKMCRRLLECHEIHCYHCFCDCKRPGCATLGYPVLGCVGAALPGVRGQKAVPPSTGDSLSRQSSPPPAFLGHTIEKRTFYHLVRTQCEPILFSRRRPSTASWTCQQLCC